MVSLVPGLSVPGPKEGRGAGWDVEACRSSPSGAQPSPAQPCPCGACYRQIGFIHGHPGGGRARPPGTRSHGGGGLSMPQSRHTTPALGPGRLGEGHGTAWLLVLVKKKKKALGVDVGMRVWGGFWGCPGPLREPLSGVEGSRCFPTRLKTHRTCYIRADTGWDGMGWGGGNIGGARLPAVAASPALSTPQGWSRAGETDRL